MRKSCVFKALLLLCLVFMFIKLSALLVLDKTHSCVLYSLTGRTYFVGKLSNTVIKVHVYICVVRILVYIDTEI